MNNFDPIVEQDLSELMRSTHCTASLFKLSDKWVIIKIEDDRDLGMPEQQVTAKIATVNKSQGEFCMTFSVPPDLICDQSWIPSSLNFSHVGNDFRLVCSLDGLTSYYGDKEYFRCFVSLFE